MATQGLLHDRTFKKGMARRQTCEVEGFHGIPSHTIGTSLHDQLPDRFPRTQVVQSDGTVAACGGQHIRLRLHKEAAGSIRCCPEPQMMSSFRTSAETIAHCTSFAVPDTGRLISDGKL